MGDCRGPDPHMGFITAPLVNTATAGNISIMLATVVVPLNGVLPQQWMWSWPAVASALVPNILVHYSLLWFAHGCCSVIVYLGHAWYPVVGVWLGFGCHGRKCCPTSASARQLLRPSA